jgi:hypothetical protein
MRSQSGKKAKPSKRQAVAPADMKPVVQARIADLSQKTDDANQDSQPMDEVFQRIAALKKRPTATSLNAKLFQYDPNKPLRIERKPEEESSGE